MAWADYFWPGSTVLRNKLGITDAAELHEAEYRFAALRRMEIVQGAAPIEQTFDAEHVKAVHRYLFQDVYDWAGRFRDVPISKMTAFAPVERIEDCLQHATEIIGDTAWRELSDERFAAAAAEVFGWLNWAHPFKDGNGRASRTFLAAVAGKADRWLDFNVVSQAVWVQRASFTVPDLDQDRPQHHWVTPLFAVMARPLEAGRDLPRRSSEHTRDSGYDLGL